MTPLNYGTIPDELELTEPYPMRLMGDDLDTVAEIVNQGIDSHLEAVFTTQDGNHITIEDIKSMRCFLRRCNESDDENAQNLASCIMETLGYEWI